MLAIRSHAHALAASRSQSWLSWSKCIQPPLWPNTRRSQRSFPASSVGLVDAKATWSVVKARNDRASRDKPSTRTSATLVACSARTRFTAA